MDIANFDSYGWTKVSLQTYDGGNNQIWNIDGDRVICDFQQYHLGVLHASQENGASVGGYQGNSNDNQKWIIAAAHASDKHISQSSCIDSTEEDIYSVVQWIPLVSSVWDLFSSIGYASAGCTSIAEERAVSASIGLVMDVATVASGGTAVVATTGIKAGIKTGITYGMKQGMKATVRVTKQSVKQFLYSFIETVAENGLRKSLNTGIKKASKLLIQETLVDPAIFLKNIGKISTKVLAHPKRVLQQSWKLAAKNIDNLKQLKKEFDELRLFKNGITESNTLPKIICRRSGASICWKGYTEDQIKMYKHLLDTGTPLSKGIETCSDRYLAIHVSDIENVPQYIKEKMTQASKIGKAELFATYQYTKKLMVNNIFHKFYNDLPLVDKRGNPISSEIVDDQYYQATLVQSYLKKNPLPAERTVYRFEQNFMDEYREDQIYTTKRFMSTTMEDIRFPGNLGLQNKKKFPIELEIKLKKSGTDISNISNFPEQKEVLIAINTKFSVKREITNEEGITRITLEEL